MKNEELIDKVAKELRLAYAEVEPTSAAHVAYEPWETLAKYRKKKWIAMARRAGEAYGLEWLVEDVVDKPGSV